MISKELLSEVLGKEEIPINICDNTLWMNDDIINIYELAHKCKEWARGHREYLNTFPTRSTGYICTFRYNIDGSYECYFEADTEPEAIFKACEWILQQKESL